MRRAPDLGSNGRNCRHREECSASCSATMRTTRAQTSSENLFVVFLIIDPTSHELGSPVNPARFRAQREAVTEPNRADDELRWKPVVLGADGGVIHRRRLSRQIPRMRFQLVCLDFPYWSKLVKTLYFGAKVGAQNRFSSERLQPLCHRQKSYLQAFSNFSLKLALRHDNITILVSIYIILVLPAAWAVLGRQ